MVDNGMQSDRRCEDGIQIDQQNDKWPNEVLIVVVIVGVVVGGVVIVVVGVGV